jgi:simple sugar transport system ATP-binding protein
VRPVEVTDVASQTKTESSGPELELSGIVKRFGAVTALDRVDLDLRRGEVHALLGENGAGKTTLMNVACGIIRADGGTIKVRGEAIRVASPRDAFQHGIGIVHQNHRLIAGLTVAQNLHIGWKETPAVVSASTLQQRTRELSERFQLDVDPSARISKLSVGEHQRVAILRTLARGARVLVLDEPTAVLTPQETENLFGIVRTMAAEGHTVVFISHKLAEVMEIADRISVLRAGRRLATLPKAESDFKSLARLMVGHDVVFSPQRDLGPAGEPVLTVDDVTLASHGEPGSEVRVSLSVRGGEILGVAGVSGNGQSELAEIITGMRRSEAGVVKVAGREVFSPSDFMREGVGHVPEDQRVGMIFDQSIETSAVIKETTTGTRLRKGPLLLRSKVRAFASQLLEAAQLGHINSARRVATLSGGQTQRVLVHREMVAGRQVLVVVHPTRGLDVAATAYVRETLLAACRTGVAIVLISEDLDEVLMLSDRIVVLYEGQIAGEVARAEFDRERIGLLMSGAAA